ncbi:DEHA2D08580p [Debaryomyces hansenii CBS767]|uniref:DEHA2D08580p n=1 Tax=Debaryomyces hansenii (strain ATCC 36239 / CBS 767 / BCRC 21394 / JCM 1990 / NBRC 0083 / IGC 2968) TaxID=284592 RepID=Q6BSI6_DEBHA|nr:DEHA2D08580p [Debaryomyces hansenii CBS767]CAG86980.1 DEHA2D08580p [Debaryomyces hansenii CBS767]|eukprot:XP_458834.1 DEHA2D08580p [Debaryomyces hansenii CBS767]
MTFDKEKLKYRAVTYSTSDKPMSITEQTISLIKQADGSFDLPSNTILVKVHSAALNPLDLVLYNSSNRLFSYYNDQQGVGRDYSGTIVAIGDVAAKKTDFCIGDNVCGMYTHILGKGTVSEYVLLDAMSVSDSSVVTVPKNLSLNEAAAWPLVLGTALAMTQGRIKIGSDAKVLVLGGSTAVGRFCIQLCKNHFKAGEVIATCSSSSAPIIREMGADDTIDYTRYPSIEGQVLQAAESGKFDIILDCCGNGDLFASMPKILKPKSHYVTIAGDKKFKYSKVSLFNNIMPTLKPIFRMLLSSIGLTSYSFTITGVRPGKQWAELGKQLIEDEKVKITVDSVHQFENFLDAIERMESQRASGKIIIELDV